MRIGLNRRRPSEISADRTSTSPASAQSTATSQVDKFSGDTVSLSSLDGAGAANARSQAETRVDSLRQQIANGEYRVDPQRIADAMLSRLRRKQLGLRQRDV